MPNWKILITDGLADSGHEVLKVGVDVSDQPGINTAALLDEIQSYDALIVRGRSQVTKEVIEAALNLKVVGRAGVGVDNIDLAAAQSRKITVLNAPLGSTIAVAELTIGLMLALVRHIARADSAMKSGQWTKKELKGVELSEKTLGIIGMGRIGSAVGQRASAFGMQILGFDPLISAEDIRTRGAESVSLNDLYAQSDFISLHLPLSPETKNMLDGQAFASMKKGVHLICAARGGVIDELALHASLESGQVRGAALDVFKDEPPGLTALIAHPNVVATPHIGAQTIEAQSRAAEHIAKEVLAALNEEPLTSKIV
ncbi:MAG: hydroxyacid dehydrogenase [Chloroflexi bacterium]|nr:hydroxyacid dehydrogenase [Chloroflexota bacterium]